MATDEGVLGRSLGHEMGRETDGFLDRISAEKLYNIYRWEGDGQTMNMVFRDHRISDLLALFMPEWVPEKQPHTCWGTSSAQPRRW